MARSPSGRPPKRDVLDKPWPEPPVQAEVPGAVHGACATGSTHTALGFHKDLTGWPLGEDNVLGHTVDLKACIIIRVEGVGCSRHKLGWGGGRRTAQQPASLEHK